MTLEWNQFCLHWLRILCWRVRIPCVIIAQTVDLYQRCDNTDPTLKHHCFNVSWVKWRCGDMSELIVSHRVNIPVCNYQGVHIQPCDGACVTSPNKTQSALSVTGIVINLLRRGAMPSQTHVCGEMAFYHLILTLEIKVWPVNTTNCITFVQCWTSVEDVGPTLYKCHTICLCLRGSPRWHFIEHHVRCVNLLLCLLLGNWTACNIQ